MIILTYFSKKTYFFYISILLLYSVNVNLFTKFFFNSKSPKDRTKATELFEQVLSADSENCRALLGLGRHLDYTGTGAPRYVEDLYTRAITRVDALLRAAPRPNLP